MITLSFGYKLPQTGDKGAPLFTALEDNITRLNDHSHNGTNSTLLTAQSITGIQDTILAIDWATYGGPIGHYRQAVTLPAGFDFDKVGITIRSSGNYVYATIEKISATQYYIYSIDNTLDLMAVYGG
jgi:hypothetical protein